VETNRKALIINNTAGQPLLAGILTGARFFVDTASDTGKGLRQLVTQSYDIVVAVENRSPQSWQICRKIRDLTDVPLIVISAGAGPEACAKAIDAGADYFLKKPFGPREFVARADALLKRSQPVLHSTPLQPEPVGV
jgi:DNA-binding response OmpR family regulator